jgi:hypothetical protein
MSAIDETTGTIARPEIKPFGSVKKGYTWFVENDVLFAKITPCMQNGKVDALKQAQVASGTERDALLPAVLERAFRGKL